MPPLKKCGYPPQIIPGAGVGPFYICGYFHMFWAPSVQLNGLVAQRMLAAGRVHALLCSDPCEVEQMFFSRYVIMCGHCRPGWMPFCGYGGGRLANHRVPTWDPTLGGRWRRHQSSKNMQKACKAVGQAVHRLSWHGWAVRSLGGRRFSFDISFFHVVRIGFKTNNIDRRVSAVGGVPAPMFQRRLPLVGRPR